MTQENTMTVYDAPFAAVVDAMRAGTAASLPTRRVPSANPVTCCSDCTFERAEYGVYRCTRHYDWSEDNARAIAQTGVGITN